MARLSRGDERAWHALAMTVSRPIESRLSGGVLANRSVLEADSMPLGPSLRRARRLAAALSRRSEVVIRTDVRSFYPTIDPAVAYRSLSAVDAAAAHRAGDMLEGWGSEGYAGLPIGPPGSAVLGNAILASVDTELEPWPFLRWVDDYLIGFPRDRDIPEALDRLDKALGKAGLERSAAKTFVLPGGRALAWPGTSLGQESSD